MKQLKSTRKQAMTKTGNTTACVLLIGTADTKADELLFMKRCIEDAGGSALVMDVGVLGAPPFAPDISNVEVAIAAGSSLALVADAADENAAMRQMAVGAVSIARMLHASGQVQGMLALGGTMGTDLALDVAHALPLGVPKFIVSTVAFSHLVPPERLAPDLMMMLWAGGLYGLNSICKSILGQAAGAVLGACGAVHKAQSPRPVVAISSLGKSCLSYMVALKPALEARGYEVAVFHCTGMGGRALESLASQRRLVAVLDLCLQEVANEANASVVSSGADRLEAAGRMGIPQIVAPGASDMIDVQSWRPLLPGYQGRSYHAHNRLIGSVAMNADERRHVARVIAQKLAQASGPTAFILPMRGVNEWDRPGQPVHNPDGMAAFAAEVRQCMKPPVQLIELDAHINDPAFSDVVMAVFDQWVEQGYLPCGSPGASEQLLQ